MAAHTSRSPSRVRPVLVLQLLLAAAAAACAVCWPFAFGFEKGQSVWWLQILSMAVLCRVLLACTTAREAFAWSAWFTTAWLVCTFWWLYIAMHTFGALPAGVAVLAIVALAAALAIYYAAAGALFWKIASARPTLAAPAMAALWTMAELARGTWFTGFGWGAMAYAHTEGPLSPWVPILGAYGVGAVALWCAAALAVMGRAGRGQVAALGGLLLAGSLSGGIPFTTSTGKLSVALLQGNIAQDEKFDAGTGVPMALQWYGEHMQGHTANLVLAPETAIPLLPQELPTGYWSALTLQVDQGHSALLTGIPLGDYQQGYTNSVLALSPGAEPWRYDKHHLVPFGEFIPPMFKWFTRMMNIPLGDFNRGSVGQPSFAWKGQRIAANICYEDLFGEELGARFMDADLAPTVFANVSNLGWFGDSTAIDQHLQISRMRALEFQRPFIRATNTGATVIMSHQGQVISALPRLTQGVLEGTVEGRTGTTPFAWWVSRFGLWPLWLLALATVVWIWRKATAKATPDQPHSAP